MADDKTGNPARYCQYPQGEGEESDPLAPGDPEKDPDEYDADYDGDQDRQEDG